MADIKKVIKGLEHCTSYGSTCDKCDYWEHNRVEDDPHCGDVLMRDALELLKEQQAEIDRLKAEKDEIIRKIGHARIDNIAPDDAKSTEIIYKHGVIDGLAYAQDIVDGKAGEQE